MTAATDHSTYDVSTALRQLAAGEPLHLDLPGGGLLYVARPVPFLTVYRYHLRPRPFVLHAEETAYCILGEEELPPETATFLEQLLANFAEQFGGLLVAEVEVDDNERTPAVTVYTPQDHSPTVTAALIGYLEESTTEGGRLTVERETTTASILSGQLRQRRDVTSVRVAVNGFFLDEQGRPFPLVLRDFRQQLHTVLRRTYFDFVRLETSYNATHFDQLGNHQVSELVWEIDRKLIEIAGSVPFLLLVTATNDDAAYRQFVGSGYKTAPHFRYRFLPVDPERLQRELFNLPIDRVKDATLAYILRDKRDETFQLLDMLSKRDSEQFRYGSLQVFGGVDDDLLATATRLLTEYPAQDSSGVNVSAREFADSCQQEFDYLSRQYPEARPRVIVRDDLSGLMVSQGVMNIGSKLQLPRHRLEALLQHEVGTHVLTYWNGRAQPLTLLQSGTPGYEDLQEGLAVLSEWFVDGITPARMRNLAARVVGIAHMLRGHDFVETFQLLHEEHDLPERAAFYTTARIYRGGGFTKDAVYLRGLVELLDYLSQGGALEPLFMGKLRLSYVPLLQELTERGILRPPPLLPRYYQEDRAAGHPKLRRLRAGMTVFDLLPTP